MKCLISLLLLISGQQNAVANSDFHTLTGGMLTIEEAKPAIANYLELLSKPIREPRLRAQLIRLLGNMEIDLRTLKTDESTKWLVRVFDRLSGFAHTGETRAVREEAMRALIKFVRANSSRHVNGPLAILDDLLLVLGWVPASAQVRQFLTFFPPFCWDFPVNCQRFVKDKSSPSTSKRKAF
ncbi:MAG: hypothetical protein ABL958_19660 [Bdellovibrionia bacterium]